MISRPSIAALVAGAGFLILSACDGGQVPSPSPSPSPTPARTVTALEVLAPTVTLVLRDQAVQFNARATFSDGGAEDITPRAAWSSSDPGVASVSSSGFVTAVASGSADISASYEGRSASKAVAVDLSDDSDWVFLGGVYAAGVIELGVYQIVVDPRDSALLYVSSDRGLFVSRNRGASWAQPHSTPGGAGTLAQDPNDPDRMFYGVRNTLLGSTDEGSTWRTVRTFNDYIRSVEISRLDGRTIFVGLQGPENSGIFRSTDEGTTWESHSFGYPVSEATQFIPWDIAEDPVDGTLYVPTELHDHPQPYRPPFFRSLDRGVTWQDVTGILPWHAVRVVVQPVTRQVLCLTEGAGLFSSTDRGRSWSRFGNAGFALELVIDPNRLTRFFGGDVLFGSRRGGVFLSTDSARTFVPYGLEGRTCGSLALSGDSSLLFAACYNSGIFVRRLVSSPR